MPGRRMGNIQLGSNGKGRATDIVYMSTQVINNVQKERDDISLCECQPLNVYMAMAGIVHSTLFSSFPLFALFVSGGRTKKEIGNSNRTTNPFGGFTSFPSYDVTTTTQRGGENGGKYIFSF